MTADDIIGTWVLEQHGRYSPGGDYQRTSDFLVGQLIYSNDGAMSVLIVTAEEATGLKDLIVYSGRFSVEGSTVFHHIDVAPKASRRGTTEKRLAERKDDLLILRAPVDSGEVYEIVWRRR